MLDVPALENIKIRGFDPERRDDNDDGDDFERHY